MIHTGDCIEVMAGMPADSVDAVVTDPPYNLEFMGKSWDKFGAVVEHPDDGEGPWGRTARVRYGKGAATFQAWCEAWGREALRVTKPGGYLLAFGGTRTHHRLVCGLEDAGWIIRDELTWVYASGFPKGRANLKPAHEPIVLARKPGPLRALNIEETRIAASGRPLIESASEPSLNAYGDGLNGSRAAGTTDQGRWPSNLLLSDPELFDVANPGVVGSGAVTTSSEWPECERDGHNAYVLPEGTIHDAYMGGGYGDSGGYSRFFTIPQGYNGTCVRCGAASTAEPSSPPESQASDSAPSGARISTAGTQDSMGLDTPGPSLGTGITTAETLRSTGSTSSTSITATPPSRRRGTSPASEPPSSPAKSPDAASQATGTTTTTPSPWMCATCAEATTSPTTSDSDDLPPNYPRFLIVPKADRSDREPVLRGQLPEVESDRASSTWADLDDPRMDRPTARKLRENAHPTVKPTDLMRHLVRLVTPPGGTVLDCFLGSGSTAIACELEGFPWIGIEQDPGYAAIAEARLNGVQRGMGLDVPAPTRRGTVGRQGPTDAAQDQRPERAQLWKEQDGRAPKLLPEDVA